MILIVLAGLCVLTVPLTGGRLERVISIQLRGLWIPVAAVAIQVIITSVAPGGSPAVHKAVHIATYGLIAVFLWCNRHLPGLRLIGLGTLLNVLAIVANGGVMPAAETAERLAGMHLRAGFDNSAHLAHAHLLWLGDIIPWPGPLHNVLSVGDCLIFAGTLLLLHRTCGRSAPRPIALAPLPPETAGPRSGELALGAAARRAPTVATTRRAVSPAGAPA